MSPRYIGLSVLWLLLAHPAAAQTNIRANPADGQIWITWETSLPDPETYAIYRSESAFSDIADAELVGRLFSSEWQPAAFRDQLANLGVGGYTNWVVPDSSGGTVTLGADEALFVDTVDEGPGGTRWYGVVKWGDTAVTAGVNLIEVDWIPDPASAPQCHLQIEDSLGSGHVVRAYAMWAHGEDDDGNGRPDFPVMGNRHKNGMPSLFFVFEALDLGAAPHPVTYWLHGGGGEASQSRPTGRPRIDIEPGAGLLVAHNDDFQRRLFDWTSNQWTIVDYVMTNTWWFGYTRNHDPFAPSFEPADTDTVVNYTQRRLIWIHQWLIDNEDVDPNRTAIQGHSMGSVGTTALAKTFPHLFSTATIYNNGFRGPEGNSQGVFLLGTPEQDLPTTLTRAAGEVVRAYDIFDLTTPTSTARDRPLFRVFHGKNDSNETAGWNAHVVDQYRQADSLGLGTHLYWDLREHGWGGIPGYWTEDPSDALQTGRDDVARQEAVSAQSSYPAFFNHQAQPDSITGDPGDGSMGSASGDDWGTWGGYHTWDPSTIEDLHDSWQVRAWLIGLSAIHPRDNCPHDSLVSDVALRRPQLFRPDPGSQVRWLVRNAAGDTLQTGTESVGEDGLVVARGITLGRNPDRRLLRFEKDETSSAPETAPITARSFTVFPNPIRESARITYAIERSTSVRMDLFDAQGRLVDLLLDRRLVEPGTYEFSWETDSRLHGIYFMRLRTSRGEQWRRVTVL